MPSDVAPVVGGPAFQPDCVLLDRDGVLNARVVGDYVRAPDQLVMLPGAADAVAALGRWARHVVVVTNQQGVGKGVMSSEDLEEVHARLREEVSAAGGRLDAVLSCAHLAGAGCACRKPRAGLARAWFAARPHLDPRRSVVVGDSTADLLMGRELCGDGGHVVWVDGHDAPDTPDPALYDARHPSLADFARTVTAAREEQLA